MPVDSFSWVKNTFQFNKDFKENYNEDSIDKYFFEVDAQYPEYLYNLHRDLPLLPKRMKIEKVRLLQPTCKIKMNVIHIC